MSAFLFLNCFILKIWFFSSSLMTSFWLKHIKKKYIYIYLGGSRHFKKYSRVLNWPRAFGGFGSDSRTKSDFLAVPGPVLQDFCPWIWFLGTWTDLCTTLNFLIQILRASTFIKSNFHNGFPKLENINIENARRNFVVLDYFHNFIYLKSSKRLFKILRWQFCSENTS